MLDPTKKIPHIQGQRRSLNKTVGGAKSHLESNPIPARDTRGAPTKPCVYQDSVTLQRLSQNCVDCLLWKYRSAVAYCRGRGSGCRNLDHTDCGISPLGGGHHEPYHTGIEQMTHKLQNNYTKEIIMLLRKF